MYIEIKKGGLNMTEEKILDMVQELANKGIISGWYQDFDGTISIAEWNITNGKEFEQASAFAHVIRENSNSIDCDDGEIECTIFVEDSEDPLDVIISCVWL